MIRESDIQWWILEAKKHPEAAPQIIQELAKRLVELDTENERLRGELLLLRDRTPTRSAETQVETLQRKVDTLQDILQHADPTDASLVLLSDRLQALRVPPLTTRELATQEQPVLNPRAVLALHSRVWARPSDELLVLTNLGRGFRRLLADVPSLGTDDQGSHPLQLAGQWPAAAPEQELESGERPTALLAISAPPRFWTIVTRRGYVQRLVRVACDQRIDRGEALFKSPVRNDEPVAIVSGDKKDLIVITRWGKAVRFAQRVIETRGSSAIELDDDDQIAAALALDSSAKADNIEIVIATASGYGIRRKSADVRARTRPGGAGKALIQAHDVLAAFCIPQAEPNSELLFITYSGNLAFASAAELPLHERMSKGTLLHDLSRDPAIAATIVH
jgi:DNA gyrase/topoisomerase IV subunit A